jgi:hypothetical protein
MTHESLITNLTLYYQTLAALHYVSPSDILSPPTAIHPEAANEAGLSPSAVSVLRELPQLSSNLNSLPLLPNGSQPVFYIDAGLDWSRKPTYQEDPEISGDAFVLTNPDIYGTSLIYDTISQKLLPWDAWGKHVDLEIAEIENPFEMDDAKPAEQIIRPWIAKLLKLEWVPFREELVTEPDEDEVSEKGDADILTQLQEKFVKFNFRGVYIACGWDDKAEDLDAAKRGFDDELFDIKKKEWMEQTQKVLDQAYEEQWSWSGIRTALGLVENGKIALLDDWLPEGQQMRHIQL